MNCGLSFIKVISSCQKMNLPSATAPQLQGIMGCRVTLRDVEKRMWIVEVERGGNGYSFNKGWSQFYQQNSLKPNYILLFTYKHDKLFDFKVFGHDACEKEGVVSNHAKAPIGRAIEEETEIENEEDGEDSSQSDETEMVMEEEEARGKHKSRSPSSYEPLLLQYLLKSPIEMVREEEMDGESAEYDGMEEEEETNNKSKAKRKYSRASSSHTHKKHDYYGYDIFESGLITQPKNPYFVSRSRHSRKNALYIPKDAILCLNLKIPLKLLLVDESGRKWGAEIKKWKDGRVWCTSGWRRLCRANNIKVDDTCICEFVQEGCNRLSMLVQVVDVVDAAARK